MMKATKKQLGFIHMLLNQLGMTDKETKAGLAQTYSSGRTTHTSELDQAEVKALIDFLKKEVAMPESSKDKMIRKILSQAHELRWELPGGQVDMARVNAYCIKYGHAHKPLDEYHEYELPMLVTQFEKMYKDFLKAI